MVILARWSFSNKDPLSFCNLMVGSPSDVVHGSAASGGEVARRSFLDDGECGGSSGQRGVGERGEAATRRSSVIYVPSIFAGMLSTGPSRAAGGLVRCSPLGGGFTTLVLGTLFSLLTRSFYIYISHMYLYFTRVPRVRTRTKRRLKNYLTYTCTYTYV